MKGFLYILITILIFVSCTNINKKKLSNSTISNNWQFKNSDSTKWHKASVPGNIHSDLFNNNLIQNPYYGNNEQKLQWISKCNWEYKTSFDVPKEMRKNKNFYLKFKGLDTYANVYLNDSLILEANNMFRTWDINVHKLIKKRNNKLLIIFLSPERVEKGLQKKSEIKFPAGNRSLTRKAAYHYGWDWAPRYITSGIWKAIELYSWNEAIIKDLHLIQDKISKKNAQLCFKYKIQSDKKIKTNFIIDILGKNGIQIDSNIIVQKGLNSYSINCTIKNPELWWTHNLGNPYLYKINTQIVSKNKIIDSISKKIGIRKIELIKKADSIGESFYFKLNSEAVFMKGANYIPQDIFLDKVKNSDYKKIISSAKKANMNMLRVWGGGIYERDIFYNLCDKYGILIWQDFMFANTLFPDNKNFISNITKEAKENIIRLRNHPCIALWCGNNEIDEAWHNWGWSRQYSKSDSGRIWDNYLNIFNNILPKLIKQNHSTNNYVSSSPKFGRGDKRSTAEGDSHYWGVWHDAKKIDSFVSATGRFMSEYGFQSYPDKATTNMIDSAKHININSANIKNHQKHSRGQELINSYMSRHYKIPQKFSDYAYVSQLLQAYGISFGIEAHRRAMPKCMGSLYWQLNDCWPAVSWSSINYSGNWKALHYFAKKKFKNIIISSYQKDEKVFIYGISDKNSNTSVKLNICLYNFKGEKLKEHKQDIVLLKLSSTKLHEINIAKYLNNTEKNNKLICLQLIDGEKVISEKFHYFTQVKNLKLIKPNIKYTIEKTELGNSIKFKTNYLAKNVFVNINEIGKLNDNYFDLIPGKEKTIFLKTSKTIKNIKNKIEIISLADCYN